MANGSEKVVQMLRDRWQQYLQVVYIIFCLYDARKSKSPPGYKAPPQSDSQETTRVCGPAEMILFGRSVSLRTADAFPVVASLPPKNREATTGNASAVRRLEIGRPYYFHCIRHLHMHFGTD